MLKGDESALIAAAAAGRSLEEIAAAAGVSVSTAQRRLRDPQIIQALLEARVDQRRVALARLNSHVLGALEKVSQLVGHDDPHVALRAGGMLMSNAFKVVLELDPEGRIARGVGDQDGDLT